MFQASLRIACCLAVVSLASLTHAANVNFTVEDITGDSVVNTDGTLVAAGHWADGDATINGATFVDRNNFLGGLNWIVQNSSGTQISSSAFSDGAAGNAPYSGLSAELQNILTGGIFRGTVPIEFRWRNLTVGNVYRFQMFINDSRDLANVGDRQVTVGSAATTGSTITAFMNTADALGGVGQVVTGTFIADAGTQDVPLLGNASSQLNAWQNRNLGPVPEPASVVLLAIGIAAMLIHRRARSVWITSAGIQ